MITQLSQGHDDQLGFTISGDVTKADYEVLTPAVEQAIAEHGSVKLLLDLTDFHWEKVEAWGADLHFGATLHNEIAKMALVGNKTWERWLTHLAQPFYAEQAQYFESADEAWQWIDQS